MVKLGNFPGKGSTCLPQAPFTYSDHHCSSLLAVFSYARAKERPPSVHLRTLSLGAAAMASTVSQADTYALLRKELAWVPGLCETVWEHASGMKATITRRTGPPLADWRFHKHAKPEFYMLKIEESEGCSCDVPEDCSLEEAQLLRKAVFCRNKCAMTIAAILEALEKSLGTFPEIVKVTWVVFEPKPALVLFPQGSLEIWFHHDALLLSTSSGKRFVVDPTGAQFGFTDWLWVYDEYLTTNTLEQAPFCDADNDSTISKPDDISGRKTLPYVLRDRIKFMVRLNSTSMDANPARQNPRTRLCFITAWVKCLLGVSTPDEVTQFFPEAYKHWHDWIHERDTEQSPNFWMHRADPQDFWKWKFDWELRRSS